MTFDAAKHDHDDGIQASYDRIGRPELESELDADVILIAFSLSALLWISLSIVVPEWLAWIGLAGMAALFFSSDTL